MRCENNWTFHKKLLFFSWNAPRWTGRLLISQYSVKVKSEIRMWLCFVPWYGKVFV
jgi:hypothetical protein